MLCIPSQSHQGIAAACKQAVVEINRIMHAVSVQLFGQGEHYMVILDRQQLRFPLFYPAFPVCALTLWTMPIAAGVVTDPLFATATALVNMPSQGRGSALSNRFQYPALVYPRPMLSEHFADHGQHAQGLSVDQPDPPI